MGGEEDQPACNIQALCPSTKSLPFHNPRVSAGLSAELLAKLCYSRLHLRVIFYQPSLRLLWGCKGWLFEEKSRSLGTWKTLRLS